MMTFAIMLFKSACNKQSSLHSAFCGIIIALTDVIVTHNELHLGMKLRVNLGC